MISDEFKYHTNNRFVLLYSIGCELGELSAETKGIIREECQNIIYVVKKRRAIRMW